MSLPVSVARRNWRRASAVEKTPPRCVRASAVENNDTTLRGVSAANISLLNRSAAKIFDFLSGFISERGAEIPVKN